jgi:hypothetical protein
MLSWINSPFTIIMLIETIVLSIISKIKLRDFFMIFGLAFMSVMAVRHVSLLALIGTICFARLFTMFFSNYGLTIDEKVVNFLSKKWFAIPSFIVVIIGATLLLNYQWSHDFIDKKFYPVAATKYIKENSEERKIVDYCLQAVLDSEDVFKWRRELQEKIDSKIAHHGVISALIGEL